MVYEQGKGGIYMATSLQETRLAWTQTAILRH